MIRLPLPPENRGPWTKKTWSDVTHAIGLLCGTPEAARRQSHIAAAQHGFALWVEQNDDGTWTSKIKHLRQAEDIRCVSDWKTDVSGRLSPPKKNDERRFIVTYGDQPDEPSAYWSALVTALNAN